MWKQISFPEKKLYLEDSKVGQMQYKFGSKVIKLLQAIKAEKFEPNSPFQYNDERNSYVFPSKWFNMINNQGKRNTRAWLYSVKGTWRTILKNLGITYIPMYNCRHTYLTHALSKTKNILLVGKLAGHTQVKTTQRYAKILGEDVDEALELIDSEVVEVPKVVQFKK
jgi:integrase